jgi:hypothetical protein
MKTFTIDNATNHITLHGSAQEAEAISDSERFSSEAALAKLAAHWPAARLVHIWNILPGVTPVQKFKDRKTAVSRIWKALQSAGQTALAAPEGPPPALQATPVSPVGEAVPTISESQENAPATPLAPHSPHVAPEPAPAKHRATRTKKTPAATNQKTARQGSKTETILAMMKQPGGSTLRAIMEATGWQAHSVRGFISGTLGKKMGLTVASVKGDDGERTYSIKI